MFDLQDLRRSVEAHGCVARVVLAEVRGSAPRAAGTAMLVWETGFSGTIGGGRLEYEALDEAHRMLAARRGQSLRRAALGPALNQCCGGAVTIVTELYDADTLPEPTGTALARPVAGDAGALPAPLARRIADGLTTTVFTRGWLAEPMGRARRPVLILGAGHVGRALATTLAPLPDFAVTLADPRPDWMTDLPPAITGTLGAYGDALATASDDTAHFVMTPEHDRDLDLCHRILSRRFAFAGLIGSATKWARFRSRLAALGHSAEDIARITCPIGDPALGKHPQAIAIGAAARLMEWEARQDAKGTA